MTTSVPFGSLLSKIIDNRGKTCPTSEAGIPLIATNCIKNEHLYPVYEKVRYVSQEVYDSWFRGHPEPGDLIFVLKGTPGRVNWVNNPVDFCIAQDMVALRVDENKVYPKYLFAVLRSSQIQQEIEGLHVGSLIPHFKKSDFDDLQIPLVEEKLQKYIGDVYFNLSLKIDLLHRQNKTLEAMAETLFRQWFIEEAKEDWEEVIISNLFEVRDGTHDSPKQSSIGYPLVTSKHIGNGILDISSCYLISQSDYDKVNSRSKVDKHDILLSMIGTLGRTYLEFEDQISYAIKNIGLFKTSQSPMWRYYIYLWLISPLGKQFVDEHKSGSTQEYLSLGSLRGIRLSRPPNELLQEFNSCVDSLFMKAHQNRKQIQTLEKLRDTLLPKLMSGEVRVQYQTEEVA
ncbi:restriction endonuclease subunit S [Acinetobacter baumannii]|uniref:restriction endonuclease subunit S n=1 Tax=Acinetobacter baumannii TaxID=470 RepID=UPI0024B636B8|nr:restriction endonuclease subunit S [Acinetobacter baumannii]MDI9703062.1 restriction endonuclease subunit S [Acinetobacter baumannii]MDI9805612.1 restriction endonuclease subunit S [Acinetobacter baumannii]